MQEDDPRKIVEKVRDDYNRIAREWDQSRMRPSQLKLDLIREVDAGMAVLDIGCGNALMLPFVLDKGAFYFGLDLSDNLVRIARERYTAEVSAGRADFVVGEATDLPFQDAEFDSVISFAVLHHLPSEDLRRAYFSELRRVLRPGGKAKITVWNLLSPWAKERFDIVAQLDGKISGDVSVPWRGTQGETVNRYMHQFSREELADLARGAGFSEFYIAYYERGGAKEDNGEEIVLEIAG